MRRGDKATVPAGVPIKRCSKRGILASFDRTSHTRRARTIEVLDVSPDYGPEHPSLTYWRGSGGYLFAVETREVQA